jgi:hypothetical protein
VYVKPKPEPPKEPPPEPAKPQPSDEVAEALHDPEFAWRLEQLVRLEVPLVAALQLAALAGSQHEIARLTGAGCPVAVAVRIVI